MTASRSPDESGFAVALYDKSRQSKIDQAISGSAGQESIVVPSFKTADHAVRWHKERSDKRRLLRAGSIAGSWIDNIRRVNPYGFGAWQAMLPVTGTRPSQRRMGKRCAHRPCGQGPRR